MVFIEYDCKVYTGFRNKAWSLVVDKNQDARKYTDVEMQRYCILPKRMAFI